MDFTNSTEDVGARGLEVSDWIHTHEVPGWNPRSAGFCFRRSDLWDLFLGTASTVRKQWQISDV